MPRPTPHQPGGLTRFQQFKLQRMHRRDLRMAFYNPKRIDKAARAKLEESLNVDEKGDGLVEAGIIHNLRTGNMVGGHQRLAIIDQLEGTDDYLIDVCVINVTEKRERELCVFLSNPAAQGGYDIEKLGELCFAGEEKFDPSRAGFDALQLDVMFDGADVFRAGGTGLFEQPPAAVLEAGRQFEEMAGKRPRKKKPEPERTEETLAAFRTRMRAQRDAFKARMAIEGDEFFHLSVVFASREQRDTFVRFLGDEAPEPAPHAKNHTVMLVFESSAQATAFALHVCGDKDATYLDGQALAKVLGVELPAAFMDQHLMDGRALAERLKVTLPAAAPPEAEGGGSAPVEATPP